MPPISLLNAVARRARGGLLSRLAAGGASASVVLAVLMCQKRDGVQAAELLICQVRVALHGVQAAELLIRQWRLAWPGLRASRFPWEPMRLVHPF